MVLMIDAPTTPLTAYAVAVSTVLAMDAPMAYTGAVLTVFVVDAPTILAVADSIVLIVDVSFNRAGADTLVIVVDAPTVQVWAVSTALKVFAPKALRLVRGPTRWSCKECSDESRGGFVTGCSEDIGRG